MRKAFLVILKRGLQNYKKILKKCFLYTTYIISLADSNFQPYNSVLTHSQKAQFSTSYKNDTNQDVWTRNLLESWSKYNLIKSNRNKHSIITR